MMKFQRHLSKCRKNPVNIVRTKMSVNFDPNTQTIKMKPAKTTVAPRRHQNLMEAMEIRAESGQ